MPPVTLRTMVRESGKIGIVLFAFYAAGALLNTISEVALFLRTGDLIRDGFIVAGTSIAILYVLGRSIDLARTLTTADSTFTRDFSPFVHEMVILAIPVILWFVVAGLATSLQSVDPVNSAVETIVLASTRTGILTAGLYVFARSGGLLLTPEPTERTEPANE